MEALQPNRFRVSEAGRRAEGSKRLIVALRSGDREAAERLVEQTYERVFASLCRMCGDRDLAADLTQDTYARAWRSLDSFEGRCQISTWLYRIAYTTFLNHVRKPQRLQTLSDSVVDTLEDPGQLPDTEIVGKLDAARVRRAVMSLPEKLRDVVGCRFWGDVSVREIAREQGVSTVAIRKRLKRAMQLLRLALEEEGS